MPAFKFIHAADLHLDSRFKGLTDIPSYVKEELLQSSFFAFSKLIDTAIEEQVSFIVISGDLFDAEERSLQAQLFLKEQFGRLSVHRISVYIIHGNHDPLSNKQFTFKFGEHVHIFPAHEVQAIRAYANDELVAYIYGISYGSKAVYENLSLKYFRHEEQPVYHLAPYHGTVGSNTEHEPYAPCSLHDLLKHSYDYVALGHIHKRQVLHEQPPVVYAGNIQGRHRNEDGERGCYLVKVDEQGQSQLSFVPLARVEWLSLSIDCTAIENEQQLIAHIQQQLRETCIKAMKCYMLTLNLTGKTELHALLGLKATQTDLLEAMRSVFPQTKDWIYINRLNIETMMPYDANKLIEEDAFLQQLEANIARLKQNNADELLQLGYMHELWLHGELAGQLTTLQAELLTEVIDEMRSEILDYVVQVKGRDS